MQPSSERHDRCRSTENKRWRRLYPGPVHSTERGSIQSPEIRTHFPVEQVPAGTFVTERVNRNDHENTQTTGDRLLICVETGKNDKQEAGRYSSGLEDLNSNVQKI